MRIALTGSTGLIGGGIFQHFHLNHEVLRIGRRPECDVQVDFTDPSTIAKLDLKGCDVLIHCAGVVDGDFVTSLPRAWYQATTGAEQLAQRACDSGVKRVIYFSATQIYGTLRGVVSEDTVPDPLSHYAMAHYVTEQIFKSYIRKGLEVLIVRPNAVYGVPTQWDSFDRWELAPYDFPLKAAYAQKIILKSSGEQKRNFIALEDIAEYAQRLLTIPVGGEAFILNGVGSETIRIVDFAQMCADVFHELTGRNCQIEKPAGSTGYTDDFQPITKHVDFKPSRHVEDFLRAFIKQVIDKATKGVVYGQRA